jgi:hypothetical protein
VKGLIGKHSLIRIQMIVVWLVMQLLPRGMELMESRRPGEGAAEMELMRRRPGEAWARHRGARAGVFGEAARGREIVQVRDKSEF